MEKIIFPNKQISTMNELHDNPFFDPNLTTHKTICIYSYYVIFIGGSLSLIPSIKTFFAKTFHLLWTYRLFRILTFNIFLWIFYNHMVLVFFGISRLWNDGFRPRPKPTKLSRLRNIYKSRKIPFNPSSPPAFPLLPPSDRKTLFLDLDHTLIFSFNEPPPPNQYSSLELIVLQFTDHTYYVVKRPGVEQLLRSAVSHDFEIVIFTASSGGYAYPILDWLDPNAEFISHRLCRDACTIDANNKIFKDIDVTGRQLDRSVIIDDDPTVYWKHYDNVLSVKPFSGELKDVELHKLLCFFTIEKKFEDLRRAVDFFLGESPSPYLDKEDV